MPDTTRGSELIRAERIHQIAVGYDATHDLQHGEGKSELTAAALCYAIASDGASLDPASDQVLMLWPWPLDQFKPSEDSTRNLIKAGALIAAEIDRRLAAAGVPDDTAPLSPLEVETRRIERGVCPKCGHMAHGSWCPNMASDSDCSCTHVTVSALGTLQR